MEGLLGRPHKISYIAKEFVSGLTNIVAKVQKPNGSLIGLFPLIEEVDSFFAGVYYFNLVTGISDPEGEYVVSIVEPTAGVRQVYKVTMVAELDVAFNFEDFDVSGKVEIEREIKGVIFPAPTLFGTILEAPVHILGKIVNNALTGVVTQEYKLTGSIIEELP